MKAHVGFIGLGAMGMPMARRLAQAGHRLAVHDRDAARMRALEALGAESFDSPAALAGTASIVFTCLPDPDTVANVVLGPEGIGQGRAAQIVVDLSTTGPRMAAELGHKLAERDIGYLDVPVSGGRRGAQAGTLMLMVSGAPAHHERVAPLLHCLGTSKYCGPQPGLAQLLKVINNMMSVAALAVTSEAFALGVKAGLDAVLMLDVINGSSGRNSATEDKFPNAVLPRTFDFGFPVRLSIKDIGLCLSEADALGVPMPIGNTVRQLLFMTRAEFGADADFTHIASLYERWAGVHIGKDTE